MKIIVNYSQDWIVGRETKAVSRVFYCLKIILLVETLNRQQTIFWREIMLPPPPPTFHKIVHDKSGEGNVVFAIEIIRPVVSHWAGESK